MIIVGLGNPGTTYDGTRHNVGFAVLDSLKTSFPEVTWKTEFGVSWCKVEGSWLLKPQEFMNLSGPTVVGFLIKKNIVWAPSDMLVIHDDLDFPLGELHQQFDRSSGGHQGVQSLIETLKTQAFSRLRIGIGNNRNVNIPAEEYVVQKFSTDELTIVTPAIQTAAELVRGKIQP